MPEYRPFPNLRHRNVLQRGVEVPLFVRALSLPRRGRVLEVGCGRGVALPVFRRLLAPTRLVGLDREAAFLRDARGVSGAASDTSVVQADVRAMPFPDASFDVVVDFGTCYHVDRAEAAILEISRVLAPGGVFATETKLAQLLAHPIRTRGRVLPFPGGCGLRLQIHAGMWARYRKIVREPDDSDAG